MTQLIRAEVAAPRLELRTVVSGAEQRSAKIAEAVGTFASSACAMTAVCGKSACRFAVEVAAPTASYQRSRSLEYGPVITLTPDSADGMNCRFACVGEPPLKDALGKLRDGNMVADVERIALLPNKSAHRAG